MIWKTPEDKTRAVHALKSRGYQSQPLRRVYIPKSDGKTMPGVSSVGDHTKTQFFEHSPGICRFPSTCLPGKSRNESPSVAANSATSHRRRDRVATMIRHASPEK